MGFQLPTQHDTPCSSPKRQHHSSWHRDPEPRLHIPIYTNPGAIMVVDNVAKHMPADGSVWITNNTKYHNAFNGGEENRVHLVACVLNYKFN